MRRKDYEILDREKMYQFLDSRPDGILSTLTKNNLPSIRTMNFVRIDDDVYFHAARTGEKVEGLDKAASFLVYKSLAMIPSYWSDERSAAPATTLYQSLIVKGKFERVDDFNFKANALQKLMEKLQPEGKYLPFFENLDFYKKEIDGLSIFRVAQNEISFKVKLGQNWKMEKRLKIRDHLVSRGSPTDLETIDRMNEYGIFN